MKFGIVKKLVAAIAVATLAIGVVGCGASKEEESSQDAKVETNAGDKDADVSQETDVLGTSLDEIKANGKLVIGTSADYPPYEFHKTIDGKDEIVGFDIDIAKEVAKDLGVELEIRDMDFNGLLIAMQAGKVDMVFAGMTPTAERKENTDFTDIYFTANHTFMVKKGDEGNYSSMEDLKGKRIGVQLGSIQEGIAKDNFEAENIKSLAKISDLALDLGSGKIDAVLVEAPVGDMFTKANEGLALVDFRVEDPDGGCAIALKKGSDEAVAEINKTIQRLKEENKIDEFVVKANELLGE